ncbi:MAG: serine/threonine-protein kinase [Gemmataceae bacterium]
MAHQPVSADQFLKALRSSGLLDPIDLVAFMADVPQDDRRYSPALAAALVRRGLLTRFQARQLLMGASKGLVLGPYRILAMLGRGGSGKVYLARDTRMEKAVALKVLPPHKAREEERHLTRFQREMELAHEVDHPNVAKAYEAGVSGGVHYIALEYVPGKTLSMNVVAGGPLKPDVAARVFAEAADGLAHAHERGLIHRDVKPSNLMITPAGHAKLLDLGLAMRPGEKGDAQVFGGRGYVVGTMDYVPPEQTRDASAVDERSDIYGLGATLFYALTGRPPFPGGTGKEKIARHRREEPPRVDEYNADVPDDLADLVDEMLSKHAENRPPSAAAVRDRLQRWAAPPLAADAPMEVDRILHDLTTDTATDTDLESAHIASGRGYWWWIAGLALMFIVMLIAVILRIRRE